MKIYDNENFSAGFHFTTGAVISISIMLIIARIFGALITPPDDCDKSLWDRCGMEVKVDNKTGIEYLVTAGGGITPRVKP